MHVHTSNIAVWKAFGCSSAYAQLTLFLHSSPHQIMGRHAARAHASSSRNLSSHLSTPRSPPRTPRSTPRPQPAPLEEGGADISVSLAYMSLILAMTPPPRPLAAPLFHEAPSPVVLLPADPSFNENDAAAMVDLPM